MSYLATVARETGWSAHHILWELPLAQGLGIEHAAAIYNGETMRWDDGRDAGAAYGPRAAMRADLQAVRARYATEAQEEAERLTQ